MWWIKYGHKACLSNVILVDCVDAIKFAVSQCDGQTIKFKKADLMKGKLIQINMNVAADMMLR